MHPLAMDPHIGACTAVDNCEHPTTNPYQYAALPIAVLIIYRLQMQLPRPTFGSV